MLKALSSTLVEILGSKKALATIAGVTAGALAHFGWHVDPNTILVGEGMIATYVLSQGVADHGKSAAEVLAASQVKP